MMALCLEALFSLESCPASMTLQALFQRNTLLLYSIMLWKRPKSLPVEAIECFLIVHEVDRLFHIEGFNGNI